MTVSIRSSVRNSSPKQHFHPEISFSERSPRSTRSWMSSSRRLLGAHTSEGGGMLAAPPYVKEEDFGDSAAIPNGGGWIGSVGAWGGRLAARRRRGNSKKAIARRD